MKINEMFISLQGEGVNRGKPSTFIRFSGCNLRCTWCDSKYAMKEDSNINWMAVVKFIASCNTKHFVFTGGEPLLQQDTIIRILKRFPKHTFEIETNGTQKVCNKLISIKRNPLYTVSPKMTNSGNELEMRKVDSCFFNELSSATKFKFVVSSYEDIKEINEFVKSNNISPENVYIMPECTDLETMINTGKNLVYPCVKNGYNLTTREQLIWNLK